MWIRISKNIILTKYGSSPTCPDPQNNTRHYYCISFIFCLSAAQTIFLNVIYVVVNTYNNINLPHLTLDKLFVELLSGMEQMDTNAGTQLARWHAYDRKKYLLKAGAMEGRPGEAWADSRVTGAWAGSWEERGSRRGITGLKRWDKGLGTVTGRQHRWDCRETEDRVKHQQENW